MHFQPKLDFDLRNLFRSDTNENYFTISITARQMSIAIYSLFINFVLQCDYPPPPVHRENAAARYLTEYKFNIDLVFSYK